MATEFDELNNLEGETEKMVSNLESIREEPNRSMMGKEIEDDLEDLLIMAYVLGSDYAKRVLDIEDEPRPVEKMADIINRPTDGKTWRERIRDDIAKGDFGLVETVVRTETERVYNEAALDLAMDSGEENIYKTWVTMHDDRVRDTHDYIEGVSLPLSHRFYTIDGDSALAPMGFGNARNNINCRCHLRLTRK